MKISTAFPSKNLRAVDLDEDVTYTIKTVKMETVGQGKDSEEKPVIYFKETELSLVCNKTNANAISTLYGDDTDAWIGKQITLFATEVEFKGEMTMAIRIRLKKPGVKPSKVSGPGPSDLPDDPIADARLLAWNAFLKKWTDFEKEHPNEAGERNTKWGMAQNSFAKTHQKKATDFEVSDWTALATEIAKNFDCGTGDFIPF